MNRRDFLICSASALGAGSLVSCTSRRHARQVQAGQRENIISYFRTVLSGFLRNARATGSDYAVCDLPGGRKLPSCCTPGGKTYTAVARMLPSMAEFTVAGGQTGVEGGELESVLLSIYRSAFNPRHPDYWGEPTGNKPTQRTVESSLVAIALARLGPRFVRKLTPQERRNVNRWFASCTVIPERTNNHAWFTATNQAARLKLGRTFPEFVGDEAWMLEDLKAMDVLAANAADGWYSDDPKLKVYDYYNFWTFGNFPLFWSRIAGELYPDWNTKLRARAREFLQHAPYFFAADGGVPLFGRSLLYRWSLLSPLLLGYEQGLWPHSPSLLRRILSKNMKWWWNLGAYDAQQGKLTDTLSAGGTPDVTEGYIDNGHPYWAMLAFTFFSIPPSDPLWTAPEEQLPVEKADYTLKVRGPKMILTGTKRSGEIRWVQAQNTPRRDYYRDKYNKFVCSSSFPANVITSTEVAPWDQTLVLRDPSSGACAWRVFPDEGELMEGGFRTVWRAELAGTRVRVVSSLRLFGEFEHRNHVLSFEVPAGSGQGPHAIEILEGSYPLGLAVDETFQKEKGPGWVAISSARSGKLLASWIVSGHSNIDVVQDFGPEARASVNLVNPSMAVISLSRTVVATDTAPITLTSLHYASAKPIALPEIQIRARDLWK